ncbi:unnamed protein product [Didymodactylos carnosus]|uniref:Uncharacterized protein n=1 Tax=Didymodactylos carnosus TaxID=1234261 RepID=A0A814HKQ1_9BILA|nr:unnamed protein product [Didymodactylos carnosus]CAF1012155.1 unnamed protein product [Didymodactylos carnosus]CAF3668379.1 unnamed protein product [Didymodactylos carnosus]CAF3783519.1 unnamed protein product [Didymodactylos carnosus]
MPSIEHIITSNETMHNNKACEPIALIGMSCTFAGGIDNPDSLWEVLKNSVDVGSEIPKERFDINSFASRYHINKPLIRRGYFVNENQFDHFDASFFGITDGEAMKMDPCHRLLLEKFVHLIEDADYTIDKIRGTRTSVHIGQFSTDHSITYNRLHVDDRTDIVGPNLFVYNASARIAYHFNLHGPNVTLDTACSSSFQAIHLAVQALRNGEADFAVAGGVNLHYTPESFIAAATTGAISPDGRSRTYSEDANGYAIGEGVGLVLLKRLSDAIRDKDRIYCVVRDIMANHDGNESKISYSVPSPYGQNMLLNEIFTRAKIDPNTVFYIEAHGTGTQVGDPIEANTLGAFFHRSQYNPPLLIGSVKSNIGHTEGAAGVASLIKVALCMKHRILTPNMHFTRINPKIHAKKYNLHIVNHTVQFSNDLVTIGINSFGMGGNNSHAIITEWSEQQLNKYFENDLDKNTMLVNGYQMNGEYKCENTKCSDVLFVDSVQNLLEVSRQHFVLTFSSTCNQSMKNQIERFHAWFSKVPVHLTETYQQLFLAHLCAKLLLKRTTSFSHRLSFIFSNFKQFQNQINSYLLNDNNCPGVILPQQYQSTQNYMVCNICFVYGGQGPQWWLMGRQLYSTEPVFRQWIDKIHLELLNVSKNSFSLIQELINTENEKCSRINDTNIAQPAIFAIQVALTALWLSWGIRPKVLIGHSVGEIAAAFVGGRLTLKEATKVIYHRSRLQHRNSNKGGRMLAVNISEDELHKIIVGLADRVEIAAINSPQSLTLSGDGEILEKIYDILITMKPNTFKAYLKTENAFHSRQMERFNIHEELIQSLSDIKGDHHNSEFNKTCSDAILYSSVTGAVVDDKTIFNAEYWWKNIRDTVLFKNAIQSILTDINPTNQIQVFLEISPHPVLSTAITECFTLFSKQELLPSSLKSPLVIHSLNRKEPEQQMMLTSLCRLFSAFGSHSIDLNTFWNSRSYSKLITTKKYNDKILKLINFYIDQLPNYAFSRQVCWSEPKDSVFIRRALRKQDHPLLGYRLWQNEARTPTWKNVFTINNSNQYAYLLDHNIQGTTLFPASGFIELAVAAVNQLLFLLSSQQQSIAFENIQFLNGLILKEDESVQIETVIIMPFREFFIYSRRKYSNDCLRLDGISGNDIITVFSDQKSLHAYSSTEWTLHSCGSINLKIDTSLISSMYNFDSILHNFSSTDNNSNLLSAKTEDEIKTLYAFFLACGLHYGPSFKTIKTLHRTQSEVLTEIEIPSILLQDQNADQQRYHLNPSVLDGCFQGLTTIIPYGDNEAFIPVGIEKLIIFGGNKGLFETAQEPNRKLYAFHTLNLSIKGTTPEKAYTDELVVFSSTQDLASSSVLKTDPIAIFQGFKIQQIPTNKVRSKPIFQKIEESIAIGNTKSVNVKELVDRFCARTYWKQVEFVHDCLEVLSDPILLLNNTPIEVNNDNSSIVVKKNNNQTFEEFVSSIPFINELSAQYIIIFLKKLLNISFSDDNVYLKQIEFRSKILAQHYNLMNSFMNILQNQGYIEKLVKQNGTDNQQWKFLDERVRDVRLINEHTIKISLVNLLNKCPQLKSILSLVELCGSNLCEIVTGKIDELQSLFGLENEILLQELISVISEDNTQSMFSALCQQIKNKISQNKDNNWVLKILEIEAGYGRSTIHILTILNDLANSTNTRIEYTFTNTSSDLFAKTKQTFDELIEEKNIKNQINITHQVFDPEQNSLSSSSVGYQQHLLNPESFHIIFGSNILNKTSNVVNCVRNIRQLLAPGGILLLNEINTCLLPYFKFIFGLLFSSWKFSSDNSAEQVVIMSEIFNQTNGFDQIHCASPNESVLSSFIIQKSNSQLILNDLSERQQQQWIIFCDHKQKVGKRLANLLSQNKISNRNITLVYLSLEEKQNQNCSSSEGKDEDSINYIKIHNTCSISSDIRNIIQRNNVSRNSLLHIVFAWPLDLAMLDDNIDDIDKFKNIFQYQEEIGCGALMYLIQSIYETKFVIQPNIFVLTQNSQPVNNSDLQNFNLTQSPVIGFARSLINEYTSNRLKLIDIQSSCLSSDFVNQLIKEMFSTISCSPNGLHDEEVVLSLCENTNVIQRWLPLYAKIEHPKSLTKSDMKTIIIPKRDADCVHFKLQVPESRFVSDLKWTTSSFESSNAIILSPTEVEVKVHCVGINFRDILKARGLHPHASDGEMDYDSDEVIGSDFSGIITRIGSNVNNNLKINDQIFGLTLQTGAIKSHIILDQNLVVKASPNFTMEQLCTLPTPFVTVIYCLRDCAHLQKGQTILIHAASGAVGLAAIQYCRMIGANVIVTAGTEKKRNFLREKYEIKHVFNSRNLSFITDIRQIAPNGVNVIINSLTGDFLQESIKLLAPAGHFIEIGKRDIYANGRLSLFPLRMSCSFHVVDLTTLQKYCPGKVQELLQYISQLCTNGILTPIAPMTVFEPSQIQQAVTIYSQATHMGKFVVRITDSDAQLEVEKEETKQQHQQQGSLKLRNSLVVYMKYSAVLVKVV